MSAQMKPTTNGTIANEPAESYYRRRLDEASASGLKQMLRSPAHFKHWVEDPEADKETPALTFGKAFHMATLEPDLFAKVYAVLPGDAPAKPTAAMLGAKKRSPESEARCAWWAQWDADNAGRIVLTAADYDRAQRMGESVRAHPVAAGLLVGGEREVTFRWTDEATGIACKARADLYAPGEFLMDLKSCRDASQEGFGRAIASYSYALQQSHYLEAIRNCGDAIRWFVFCAVESEPPYVCQPHLLGVRTEQLGYDLRTRAITRQAACLAESRWPGYSDHLMQTEAPTWAFYNSED